MNDFSNCSQGHLLTIVDASGKSRRVTADQAILRPGEIGVIFCLPIIGAPTLRLRDIDLGRNQFARIFCGVTTIDVFSIQKNTTKLLHLWNKKRADHIS